MAAVDDPRAEAPAAVPAAAAQRRQAYRVRSTEPPAPTVTLRHPSMPEMRITLPLVDVSAGGCALPVPDDVPPLQPGTRLNGARIDLDDRTRFECALQLQHVSTLGGTEGPSLGCLFVGVDPAAQRALQRWIDRTQQRQRRLARSAP